MKWIFFSTEALRSLKTSWTQTKAIFGCTLRHVCPRWRLMERTNRSSCKILRARYYGVVWKHCFLRVALTMQGYLAASTMRKEVVSGAEVKDASRFARAALTSGSFRCWWMLGYGLYAPQFVALRLTISIWTGANFLRRKEVQTCMLSSATERWSRQAFEADSWPVS